jgi:hypothetical protein
LLPPFLKVSLWQNAVDSSHPLSTTPKPNAALPLPSMPPVEKAHIIPALERKPGNFFPVTQQDTQWIAIGTIG